MDARAPESDEELRHFLDQSTIGLRWIDPDGRVLWANRAELALVGCALHQYVGHHVAEFLVEPQTAGDLLARLARHEPVEGYRARLRARDGSVKDVLIDGQGLFRDGRLVHSRCFTRDITGLLEREEAARHRAEETSHLQDEFLALLSHELRAPLGTVLLWLGLLRQGGSEPDETARALEIMDRSARTLEHIVEDLLHASRIAAGGLSIVPQLVDLRTLVADAVEAAAGDAHANGLHLDWSPGAGPVPVLADPGRLQQAVANLLSNAIKFTPAGGRVQVGLEANQQARLRVSDSGEGMSPGFLPFAFGRFRQQDSTSTRRHHGLGLGLYVVRHVIEHHGGSVQAESEGPGRGSTFTVVLPLARIDDAWALPEAAPLARVSLPPGLKILVVDDEIDVRDALKLILQQSGALVDVASSAQEAFAAMETLRPDIILSDIAMPEEDGLSFIRRVRQLPSARGGRVPAAALSAYAGTEHRRQALAAGFQDHVRKPIEPAHLLAVIARLSGMVVAVGAE
jgi:PAS domain S-box-containing protein